MSGGVTGGRGKVVPLPGSWETRTAALPAAVHDLLTAPVVQRLPPLARAHLPPGPGVPAETVTFADGGGEERKLLRGDCSDQTNWV